MSSRRYFIGRRLYRRTPAPYASRRVGGFWPKHTKYVGFARFPFFAGRDPKLTGNDGEGNFIAPVRIKVFWKREKPNRYGTRFSIYPNTLVRNRHKWRHPRNQFSLPKPEKEEDYESGERQERTEAD